MNQGPKRFPYPYPRPAELLHAVDPVTGRLSEPMGCRGGTRIPIEALPAYLAYYGLRQREVVQVSGAQTLIVLGPAES